jgi:hypothetical protein
MRPEPCELNVSAKTPTQWQLAIQEAEPLKGMLILTLRHLQNELHWARQKAEN